MSCVTSVYTIAYVCQDFYAIYIKDWNIFPYPLFIKTAFDNLIILIQISLFDRSIELGNQNINYFIALHSTSD